ncbi:response regulator [Paenibacillus tritici]|uniref:Response regulator n=1 Tax=Paenibacillus tritici TaxID=1873425 RepID=A0ABX2DN97_9BACL|nr:response regulator [Paenibacillus tritici]NQX45920.1 response regulator [Paenibacillus tritici]
MIKRTYTMVVIDDIRAVVNGISRDMDWSELGIDIVGTASSGEGGLALVKKKLPDIIVTDIRMPRLSGIEMMRELRPQLPHAKFIFISGYSDFDHAQEALRLGAFDYILKPFTPRQLAEVVKKAAEELERERQHSEELSDMQQKLRESMPLLRQEYLSLLVRFSAQPETLRRRWEFLQMDMQSSPLAVVVLEIDHFVQKSEEIPVNDAELLRFAVQNIVEETVLRVAKGTLFRESVHRFVLIINTGDGASALGIAEECRENAERYSKCTVSAGVSRTVQELDELPVAYQQAVEALTYTFYTGGNSVFFWEHITQRPEVLPRPDADLEKELVYALRSGNAGQAEKLLLMLLETAGKTEALPSPDSAKALCVELAALIRNAVPELAGSPELTELMKALTSPRAVLNDLRESLKQLSKLSCAQVQSRLQFSAQEAIQAAIRYIREHLHLNLLVGDYAAHVHLSTSYFSNLFKKVTGLSVGAFVIQEKMEQAKLLLAGDRPIAEIAESLGYEERSYFSDVFKKTTGMTPTEFRAAYGPRQGNG